MPSTSEMHAMSICIHVCVCVKYNAAALKIKNQQKKKNRISLNILCYPEKVTNGAFRSWNIVLIYKIVFKWLKSKDIAPWILIMIVRSCQINILNKCIYKWLHFLWRSGICCFCMLPLAYLRIIQQLCWLCIYDCCEAIWSRAYTSIYMLIRLAWKIMDLLEE